MYVLDILPHSKTGIVPIIYMPESVPKQLHSSDKIFHIDLLSCTTWQETL